MDFLATILTWRKVYEDSGIHRELSADNRAVRTTRARIIRLKNDYKELMNSIEIGLHQHHASLQESGDSKESQPQTTRQNDATNEQSPSRPEMDPPFAKVNSVAPSSPAQEAGLKVGDKIRNFGSASWRNHENLRKVAEVVQRSEGVGEFRSIHFAHGQRLTGSC
jgi:26S proteasome regulatory subunit N4